MKKLHKEVIFDYKADLKNILNENDTYKKQYKKKTTKKKIFKSIASKIVIPNIEPFPRSNFFIFSNINIRTIDDPILRFIPYLPGTKGCVDLIDFKGTEITEKPYGIDTELLKRFLKKIFFKEETTALYLKKYENKKLYKTQDKYYSLAKTLSNFLKIDLSVVNSEMSNHIKKDFKENNMLSLFCNACLLFDCKWHEKNMNMAIKPVGFEIKPSLAWKMEDYRCDKYCEKLLEKTKNYNHHSDISTDFYVNKIKSIYKAANENICITSKIFFYLYGVFVKCDSLKEFLLDTSRKSLFGIYESKEKISELAQKHLEYKSLTTFKNEFDLKKLTLKSAFLAKEANNHIDLTAFYSPCNHHGSCSNKKSCRCYMNRTYCEETCFCTNCNLLFRGCNCINGCGKKCVCRKAKRECTSMCKINNCNNMAIQNNVQPLLFVDKSKIAGYGLFAAENIEKDTFVIEYSGEIISNSEAERRGSFYDFKKSSYLFDLCFKDQLPYFTVDSALIGNMSRFINHSSKRNNVVPQIINVNGIKRIAFFSLRRINKYEELLFDYKYTEEHKIKHGIIE